MNSISETINLYCENIRLRIENIILKGIITFRYMQGFILRKIIKLIYGLTDEDIDKFV